MNWANPFSSTAPPSTSSVDCRPRAWQLPRRGSTPLAMAPGSRTWQLPATGSTPLATQPAVVTAPSQHQRPIGRLLSLPSAVPSEIPAAALSNIRTSVPVESRGIVEEDISDDDEQPHSSTAIRPHAPPHTKLLAQPRMPPLIQPQMPANTLARTTAVARLEPESRHQTPIALAFHTTGKRRATSLSTVRQRPVHNGNRTPSTVNTMPNPHRLV